MTADGLVRAVRGQLGLGRLLPLGGPADGVWIAERAALGVLREAEHAAGGVRLEAVRIGLAEPDAHDWGAVRAANPAAPPSALPVAPLRIEADFTASGDHPLPRTAALLRGALAGTAERLLGLAVAAIDLRVVGLLDDDAPAPRGAGAAIDPVPAGAGAADPVAAAAAGVPGVAAVTARLPGLVPSAAAAAGPDDGSPRVVRVQIAVAAGHRALDVALAVRAAITSAAQADAPGGVATRWW